MLSKRLSLNVSIALVLVMLLSLFNFGLAFAGNDITSTPLGEKDAEALEMGGAESGTNLQAAAKSNVIVVVPGIMGSELQYGSKVIWAPKIGSISMAPLECNENGASLNTIVPYNADNFGAQDTYEALYTRLKNEFSAVADVKFYPYDWRLSCGSAATGLKTLVSSYTGQIVIVAHSMGGLVSSEYLRNATTSQRSRTTLITLGTPFTGAAKAFQILETGDMDLGFFGDLVMTDQIKKYANDFPAVYQLLPSSRSPYFFRVGGQNGSYKTYEDAINIIKTLSWAKKANGTVKPMLASAQSFMKGIDNNNSHYAYTAHKTYHIAANGKNTVNAVYYNQNSNGTYTYAGVIYDNSGDGTVPLLSAINRLPTSSFRVSTYSNIGDHTSMTSNTTVLNEVEALIKNVYFENDIMGASSCFSEKNEQISTPIEQNARGWITNQGLDGRRINININYVQNHQLCLTDGRELVIEGDIVFCRSQDGTKTELGNMWTTGIGVQYALFDGQYAIDVTGVDSDSSVVVSYMENGYFDYVLEYKNISVSTEDHIIVQNYSDVALNTTNDTMSHVLSPSHSYSTEELQLMNQD